MKPTVLYLCVSCAEEISSGARLIKIKASEPENGQMRKCEWCNKPRRGDAYVVRDKERK